MKNDEFKKDDDTLVLSVLEAIHYAIDNGIPRAVNQLNYWNRYGLLRDNNAKSLVTSLYQLFEEVEMKGRGKSGIVYLKGKKPELDKRIDKRLHGHRTYNQGANCKINERHKFDREYAWKIREFYDRKRIRQGHIDAWYKGIEHAERYKEKQGKQYFTSQIGKAKEFQEQVQQSDSEIIYYIYRFIVGDEIQYIGKSKDIAIRLNSHFHAGHLTEDFYKSIDKIEFIELEDEFVMDALEIYLINKLRPKQNTEFINGEFKKSNLLEYFINQEWIEFKNLWKE